MSKSLEEAAKEYTKNIDLDYRVYATEDFEAGWNAHAGREKELGSAEEAAKDITGEQFGELITNHIGRMWGGLEMASIEHFIETGKITGSFRLRLISLMKFYQYSREALPQSERERELIEALEYTIKYVEGLEQGNYPIDPSVIENAKAALSNHKK